MFTSRRSTSAVSSFQYDLFDAGPNPAKALSTTGQGMFAALAGWFDRAIATEHICDPPDALGRFWAIERPDHQASAQDRHYCCPECQERWVGASH
jgi:hypothetical protein